MTVVNRRILVSRYDGPSALRLVQEPLPHPRARPGPRQGDRHRIVVLRDRFPGAFRKDLTTLFDLLAKGETRPAVADRLPLEQAALAHERLASARVTGKQVLVCGR
ncbi:zinc-binding dehydrogenase [Planobispora siamensis]|uniref:Zinc-binding dehydrogenase n=1 Tax=Planobispora siamensis TaxID=936338 RepID=A0A8J3WMD5_9ACTN|nr:zinc-binding dehydrogenase [Planobispora siamensis]GIH96334.1 hypothetical protein Psi01_69640 [Planobispora siamensis]